MDYGIQRRSIYLVPPEDHELPWLFREFDRDEVWQMFGLGRPGRSRIMRAYRTGNLVMGIIRRVADQKRIGFMVFFPPNGDFDFWEFGYAISDPADRDGYSALNVTDASAHYMLDHCRVEAVGWRTREDNRAADAVVRRLGYEPFGKWSVDGHVYSFYRLDQARWAKRRAKLEEGERRHPSGLGETFVTLLERPFTPRQPVPTKATE